MSRLLFLARYHHILIFVRGITLKQIHIKIWVILKKNKCSTKSCNCQKQTTLRTTDAHAPDGERVWLTSPSWPCCHHLLQRLWSKNRARWHIYTPTFIPSLFKPVLTQIILLYRNSSSNNMSAKKLITICLRSQEESQEGQALEERGPVSKHYWYKCLDIKIIDDIYKKCREDFVIII